MKPQKNKIQLRRYLRIFTGFKVKTVLVGERGGRRSAAFFWITESHFVI